MLVCSSLSRAALWSLWTISTRMSFFAETTPLRSEGEGETEQCGWLAEADRCIGPVSHRIPAWCTHGSFKSRFSLSSHCDGHNEDCGVHTTLCSLTLTYLLSTWIKPILLTLTCPRTSRYDTDQCLQSNNAAVCSWSGNMNIKCLACHKAYFSSQRHHWADCMWNDPDSTALPLFFWHFETM